MMTFFIVFFSLYIAVNTYIFIRGWQALAVYPQFRIIYAAIFVLAASSYIVGRAFSEQLPYFIYVVLIWIGSFWFLFLFYFFLSIVLIDLIRLADKLFRFIPNIFHKNPDKTRFYTALIILLFTLFAAGLGYINRLNVKIKELDINITDSPAKEYRIVFFSDLHISVVNNHQFVKKIVDKINSLNPDLILIGGDLVDEKAVLLRKYKLAEELKNLQSKFGVYSITGNHEYINGADSTVNFLEKLGIKFLRDEVILMDSSFYIIGREDYSKFNFTKKRRKSLDELVQNLEKAIPKILLDHQPLNLNEAADNMIDLQLSGHTHHGQIAPANIITNLVYEVSWGYKKKEKTHVYVTSGIGTWGPPVKIGNDAELIFIKFKF